MEIDGWWRIGRMIVVPATRLLFRLRFLGAERIPENGPAILAANHVSMLDGPTLCIAPYSRGRIVRSLVAAEFFDVAVIGWCLRRLRQIPIRRGRSDTGALDEAIATIRAGAIAGIFPEGSVNPDPDHLQRVHTGVARIALASGAPVIPVGIWGTQWRWSKSGGIRSSLLRHPLTFAFGEPLSADGDPDDLESVAAFTRRVEEGIRAASASARADAEQRAAAGERD
ncbi:MAG: lysophospholipid acyltransferase family protein [Actinomycetota bacterium]